MFIQDLLVAALGGAIGNIAAGIVLELLDRWRKRATLDRPSVSPSRPIILSLRATVYHFQTTVAQGQKPASPGWSAGETLLILGFIAFVVLKFLKDHLDTAFLIAYALAFFGLGFAIFTLVRYVIAGKRVQPNAWREGALRLALWLGVATTTVLARFSTVRMELPSLGNIAEPLALMSLFPTMVFFLLMDLVAVWCIHDLSAGRLPPRIVYYWWQGRWFIQGLALVLLLIAFAVSVGLFPIGR